MIIKDLTKEEKLELLVDIVNEIKKDISETKDEGILIPVSIFNKKLGSLEAIAKYLKEVLNIKVAKIASLLNRNDKTIWTTYNNAKRKLPQKFIEQESKFNIPISIFESRKLSVLESIVVYLKENYDLSFNEIANMLKRDYRTIWTVYKKAKNYKKAKKKFLEKVSSKMLKGG